MLVYVALLRGINVGGNRPIKMAALREVFEKMGFEHVETVLNSGNVIFSSAEADMGVLEQRIRPQLFEQFGHDRPVMLRTIDEIRDIVRADPFKQVTVTEDTRLYVTFITEEPEGGLQLPYQSPEKDMRILALSGGAVFSAVTLSPQRGTTELMKIIDTEFGREVTTRNWNTILKIATRGSQTASR